MKEKIFNKMQKEHFIKDLDYIKLYNIMQV